MCEADAGGLNSCTGVRLGFLLTASDSKQRRLFGRTDVKHSKASTGTKCDLSPTCVHVHLVLMLASCQLCFTSQLDCSRRMLSDVQQKGHLHLG